MEGGGGDLSFKGRFFQAANPVVDCVCKGPPSSEFPVRREARSLSKTKARGLARERSGRVEERREEVLLTLLVEGRKVRFSPRGEKARGR